MWEERPLLNHTWLTISSWSGLYAATVLRPVLARGTFRAEKRRLMDDHEIEVHTIAKSWREPDFLFFKVETGFGLMSIILSLVWRRAF